MCLPYECTYTVQKAAKGVAFDPSTHCALLEPLFVIHGCASNALTFTVIQCVRSATLNNLVSPPGYGAFIHRVNVPVRAAGDGGTLTMQRSQFWCWSKMHVLFEVSWVC